jgi:hypothetical protein
MITPGCVDMDRNMKIEIIKADDFKQIYSIGAMGGHSPYDFRIAFYNDTPRSFGNAEETRTIDRKIETEITLSPAAAKELSVWLNRHVSDYEKMFGTITIRDTVLTSSKEEKQDTTQIQGYM